MTITRLVLGLIPPQKLLEEYSLTEQFSPLVTALVKGNVSEFMSHLESEREWFIARGSYMILKERLQLIMYRTLIRRTYVFND